MKFCSKHHTFMSLSWAACDDVINEQFPESVPRSFWSQFRSGYIHSVIVGAPGTLIVILQRIATAGEVEQAVTKYCSGGLSDGLRNDFVASYCVISRAKRLTRSHCYCDCFACFGHGFPRHASRRCLGVKKTGWFCSIPKCTCVKVTTQRVTAGTRRYIKRYLN